MHLSNIISIHFKYLQMTDICIFFQCVYFYVYTWDWIYTGTHRNMNIFIYICVYISHFTSNLFSLYCICCFPTEDDFLFPSWFINVFIYAFMLILHFRIFMLSICWCLLILIYWFTVWWHILICWKLPLLLSSGILCCVLTNISSFCCYKLWSNFLSIFC
jgi:hypothetical protein